MSEVAGLWGFELEKVIRQLTRGGTAKVVNHNGKNVLIKVEKIAEERCGSNTEAYA